MDKIISDLKMGLKKLIRLDKNFHIYIHGDASKIEVEKDEKGYFMKLYFEEMN